MSVVHTQVHNFRLITKSMPFSLGSSVKLSQLKYTLSENQGLISVDVLHIGESDTSVKVKLLLGDQNDSSVAFGKLKNFISQHTF